VLEFRLWVDLDECCRRAESGVGGEGDKAECRREDGGGGCSAAATACCSRQNDDMVEGLAGLMVRVQADGANPPQIDVPVHALFLWSEQSLAVREHEVKSLLVGHKRGPWGWAGYLHFPIPFSSGIEISLRWAPHEARAGPEYRAGGRGSAAGEGQEGGGSAEGWKVSYSILSSPSMSCDAEAGAGAGRASGGGVDGSGEAEEVGRLHVVHRRPAAVQRHMDYPLFDLGPGHGGSARGLLVGLATNIEAAGISPQPSTLNPQPQTPDPHLDTLNPKPEPYEGKSCSAESVASCIGLRV